jgi:hypothetical protein
MKMTTALEGCTTKEQRYVVDFCGKKYAVQRIFIKKYFLFTVGKCVTRKAVHNWVEKFSQGHSKVIDNAQHPGAEVAETTVKRLVYCGFRGTDKAMRHTLSMFVEDMSRNDFSFRFEYHTFYRSYFSLYILGTHRRENIASNSSSTVVSHGYRLDRVENSIPVLLFTAIT